MYLCETEQFEIELFICIKMDLALITYNGWCAIKPNQTKFKTRAEPKYRKYRQLPRMPNKRRRLTCVEDCRTVQRVSFWLFINNLIEFEYIILSDKFMSYNFYVSVLFSFFSFYQKRVFVYNLDRDSSCYSNECVIFYHSGFSDSSLLLYSQRFDRWELRPSSGVSCRIQEP